MKRIIYKFLIRTKKIIWALIVAYMLGLHNFYKGESKALDDIIKTKYTIEHNEVQEEETPKN